MLASPFANGFLLGFSLILAIGAQNSFVLRQGLAKNNIIFIIVFCAVSDMLLIIAGIAGIGHLAERFFTTYRQWIFIIGALWIAWYGITHLLNVFKSFKSDSHAFEPEKLTFSQTAIKLFILTFINPHVYLDTLVLIGILSLQYEGADVWNFGIGACIASITFFSLLGFGATIMSSFFRNPAAWRILDCTIAMIMFSISAKLFTHSNIF